MLSVEDILQPENVSYTDNVWTWAVAHMLHKGEDWQITTITDTAPIEIVFLSKGEPLTDYFISGNTVQDGTPTPSDPVDVVGCGVRTKNIYNTQETVWIENALDDDGNPTGSTTSHYTGNFTAVKPNTLYYISRIAESTTSGHRIYYYDSDKNWIGRSNALAYNDYSFTTVSGCKYIQIQIGNTIVNTDNWMISEGLSQVSFEPYGYKLPLTVNGTEYPIYLGQVPTTRRIKKLVFDGTENWTYEQEYSRFWISVEDFTSLGLRSTPFVSNTFGCVLDGRPIDDVPNNTMYSGSPGAGDTHKFYIKCTTYTSIDAFKAYLAAQYAAGTPVTVWYILATPETAIVNEPLHKISTYADTISMEQAGVTIPTVAGANTLTIDTTVQPSSMSITGKIREAADV